MGHLLAVLAIWAGFAGWAGAAECVGRNLFDAMPDERRAQIDAAVAVVPYHRGLLWRATRGDQVVTLVGTYHFGDPRHGPMMERLEPDLRSAAALYVEAGPEEEARLTRALTESPDLMVNAAGPTLPERLSQPEWRLLAAAMADRGTPSVVTAKLRPWYVAMLLGISPCMMRAMADEGQPAGLDRLLVARAQDLDLPVRPLEPWDTVFSLFAGLTPDQEIDMIRASLPAAAHADDYAVTLTDAYFAGDVWRIWEFGRFDGYASSGLSRAQVDEQMALAQSQLMDRRNRDWIAPLTAGAAEAARRGKGIVAGFGALHLPGEQGVLRLLEKEGWTITRLDGEAP
ncbi:TraB/GumN family protein [Paracoccus spongiarum]|uniref:TraB/GumN family protein n=1 Tax=Paracoccus spongiarum TaxID=3064387 RepID=A0ABT9JEK9_9RHOB|nr:TraB/GumN family protein [Paracoccus sp. 2205BS29-5]MDP5308263.1 TraB/GumN family protein [Paracoccus sp. 2205BS29-5]